MISAQDELERFWDRKATLFSDALLDLASARLDGGQNYIDAFEELTELTKHTLILSNLFGRKRMLMEADAVRERSRFDATEKTPLSRLVFEEAIADLVSREPRLAKSSLELSMMYTTEHVFGMVQSMDLILTKRVQEAIADLTRAGKPHGEAVQVIQEITPFARSYGELVYRNNLSTNYTLGRRQQAEDPDVHEVVPAFRFTCHYDDGRIRPNHKAADGFIAATSDPIWKFYAPPWGHQCRCGLEYVSVFEIERRGLVRNGKVARFYPSTWPNARPDANFKVGAIQWEAA